MRHRVLRAFGFIVFVISTFTFTTHAQAVCPYGSIQTYVRQSTQFPWSQNINISLGQTINVGVLYNGTSFFTTNGVTIQATGPYGYDAVLANNSITTLPYPGIYVINGVCEGLKTTAIVNVSSPTPVATCPYPYVYTSLQTRVRANATAPWTQSLGIYLGQSVNIGTLYNFSNQFAPHSVTMTLTGPYNFSATVANNSFPVLPYPGTYTLRGVCGSSLTDYAYITVYALPCSYGSLQARVQPNLQTAWTNNLTINLGQNVHLGAMYNGTGQFASGVAMRLTGGYPHDIRTVNNDSWVTPANGPFTLRAFCGGVSSDEARIYIANPPPPATCPYSSIQARVQPNKQTAWTTSMTVNPGQGFYVGAMYNGTGYFAAPAYVALTITGPNGFVKNTSIDALEALPYVGTYTLRATCGGLQDVANINVVSAPPPPPSCPYSSIQARVQPNKQTAWTTSLTVNSGQGFYAGAMYNATGQFASPAYVALTLSNSSGFFKNSSIDAWETLPVGTYTLRAVCGGLQDIATVTVNPPAAAGFKLPGGAGWSTSLTVEAGQQVQLGDGTLLNTMLTLAGPGGYLKTFANNSVVILAIAGIYTLTASVNGVTSTATLTVNRPVLSSLPPPPSLPSTVPDFCYPTAYTQEYNGGNLSDGDKFEVAPSLGNLPMRALIYWPQYRCTVMPLPIIFIVHGQVTVTWRTSLQPVVMLSFPSMPCSFREHPPICRRER
jgi:hypothetical protein